MQIDIDYAYSLCKDFTLRHYENFPVGSFLIPTHKRKYIYSIYSFARYSDDIADSTKFSEEEKLNKLVLLEKKLLEISSADFNEQVKKIDLIPETDFIFTALSNTIKELNIPVEEFTNLLAAFRQDSVKSSYLEFSELLDYSELSANPVGHLVLYVFGYNPVKDKVCFDYSDKICTALQLTNFWQDVSVDLKMKRVYIPAKVMNENHYNMEMLFAKTENEDFRNMIRDLCERTKKLFLEGKDITKVVNGRLKYELKATIAGGIEILNKIEKLNYSVLSERVKLSKPEKIKLLVSLIRD